VVTYLNFGSLVFALLHVAFKDAPEKSWSDSGGKSEVILASLHVTFKDAPEKSMSDSGGKSEVILLLEQY
jgi:hypothetical protein